VIDDHGSPTPSSPTTSTNPANVWQSSNSAAAATCKTRSASDRNNVKIPAAKLELRKTSLVCIQACQKSNDLPSEIKISKTVREFKNGYHRHVDSLRQAD